MTARGGLRWYDAVLVVVLLCLPPIGWLIAIWLSYRRKQNASTPACAACGQRTMIPTDTPEGSRLAQRQTAELATRTRASQ